MFGQALQLLSSCAGVHLEASVWLNHARTTLQAAKLSSFQLEVSDALGQLGIEHELEYMTAVNLLSVDIAIVKDGALSVVSRTACVIRSLPVMMVMAW